MGKAWLFNHFEANVSIEDWYWSAADVTHVMADLGTYLDPAARSCMPRYQHNELLYALEKAPYLSEKHHPLLLY